MRSKHVYGLLMAVCLVLCMVPATVYAACGTITSLPKVISNSTGTCWKLANNLSTPNGSGITINNSSNVVIDLAGYSILNTGAVGDHAVTVIGSGNVTIKNGSIVGYSRPIHSDGTDGEVPGNLYENLLLMTASPADCQIEDHGNGTIIRNNVLRGSYANPTAYGICSEGVGGRVINNDITDFSVAIDSKATTIIDNNRINWTNGLGETIVWGGGLCRNNIASGCPSCTYACTDLGNNY